MTDTPQQERWIKNIPVSMIPPDLKDNTADVDRLIKGLEKALGSGEVRINLSLSKKTPSLLREHHYHAGATMALLSLRKREEADEIRNRVTYVEMNVNQDFMNPFSAAKFIPHTDRAFFPSVSPW